MWRACRIRFDKRTVGETKGPKTPCITHVIAMDKPFLYCFKLTVNNTEIESRCQWFRFLFTTVGVDKFSQGRCRYDLPF